VRFAKSIALTLDPVTLGQAKIALDIDDLNL